MRKILKMTGVGGRKITRIVLTAYLGQITLLTPESAKQRRP